MVSNYFADTSVLAKRYLSEMGSSWVLSWIEPSVNHVIVLSELAFVEIRSVLHAEYAKVRFQMRMLLP